MSLQIKHTHMHVIHMAMNICISRAKEKAEHSEWDKRKLMFCCLNRKIPSNGKKKIWKTLQWCIRHFVHGILSFAKNYLWPLACFWIRKRIRRMEKIKDCQLFYTTCQNGGWIQTQQIKHSQVKYAWCIYYGKRWNSLRR